MRIAFAGTPAAAVPSLRALAGAGHEIACVLTRPDAPVGRKRLLSPSPVKVAAGQLGLEVVEAARLRGDVLTRLEAADLDAVAVVAYGALAGPRALAAARLGWFNLHFSLLPQWRGAAPVQRALMAGQVTSGLTVFRLDTGMDTGEILLQRSLPLPAQDAGAVLAEYAETGARLLTEAFDLLASGTFSLTPQEGEVSYAEKIDPAEAQLDFTGTTAQVLARYRGVSPAPGAWAETGGRRTKLFGLSDGAGHLPPGRLEAAGEAGVIGTGDGAVRIERIQPSGKPVMEVADFLRGHGPLQFDTRDPAPVPGPPAGQARITGRD